MKKIISFILALVLVSALLPSLNIAKPETVSAAEAVNMNGVASYNTGITAVPAPGEVVIDGELDDWDRTGEIYMFADYNARESFGNQTAVMWDKDFIYLYHSVSDETPAEGYMNPTLEHARSWMGDSVQCRIKTDRYMWLDVSYHHQFQQSLLAFDYWKTPMVPADGNITVNYISEPSGTLMHLDKERSDLSLAKDGVPAEMAVKIHEDGKGYTFEYKLRWDLIYDQVPEIKAGLQMNIGFDTNFGTHGKAGRITYFQDNVVDGKYPSSFFCNEFDTWGYVTLSGTGNVEKREYIPEAALNDGCIPIDVEIPKDAKYITLVMDDNNGKRICTLEAEKEITADMIVSETATTKTVRYLWNGRNPQTNLTVSAGKYRFSALSHNGLSIKYDTHFYNPNKIPWGTGAKESWTADHVPPLAVTTGGGYVYIACIMVEGGSALLKTTENEADKQWGIIRGARHMEYYDEYLYCVNGDSTWLGNNATGDGYIMKVDCRDGAVVPFSDGKGGTRPLDYPFTKMFGIRQNTGIAPETLGIAVSNDKIFVSTSAVNPDVLGGKAEKYIAGINVVDINDLTLLKRIPLDGVGKMAKGINGEIYAISSAGVSKIDSNSYKVTDLKLKNIPDDFNPTAIAVDLNGNVVVFDNGSDKQLKAFNPETGALMYTAAQKGGRPLQGKWEEQGLTKFVSDIDVDSQNRIWVIEELNYPRRVSVWGTDGKLVADYIGPTDYTGSGSYIHTTNPDLAYYGPVEMKLNRKDNTYEVTRVLWLPEDLVTNSNPDAVVIEKDLTLDPTFTMMGGNTTAWFFESDKSGEMHSYAFVNQDAERTVALFMEREDGLYYPIVALGTAESLGIISASETVPSGSTLRDMSNRYFYKNTPMIWNDGNADGRVQVSECEVIGSYGTNDWENFLRKYWGGNITEDFEFILGYASQNSAGYMYTPAYFREDGAPVYTADKSIKPVEMKYDGTADTRYYQSYMLYDDEKGKQHMFLFGNTTISSYNLTDNKLDWSYPNQFMGVNGSHNAIMPAVGLVIGALKILGVVDTEAGKVFAIRGNLGEDYWFHEDGYFIQTCFDDTRKNAVVLGGSVEDMKGTELSNSISNGGEPFAGILVKQSDGKIRLTLDAHSQVGFITEVTGFETISITEPVTLNITQTVLDNAEAYRQEIMALAEASGKKDEEVKVSSYTIKKVEKDAITIDGEYKEWEEISGLDLKADGASEFATSKLAYDGENLYGLFDIDDVSPMINGADEYQLLFKKGDMVDIQLSPSNNKQRTPAELDGRIMISMFKGKPVAVLDRTTNSRAPQASSYTFASPVIAYVHDEVVIMEDVELVINKLPSSAVVEIKIPLKSVGIDNAKSGLEIGGDLGIITSDVDGMKNMARIYYFNKQTGLTSDMPSESVFYPDRLGTFIFE